MDYSSNCGCAATATAKTPPQEKQSNKFWWKTHDVPRSLPSTTSVLQEEQDSNDDGSSNKTCRYVIRSLKQGSTGAVKTWSSCEVLLEYLVLHGGLRDVCDKVTLPKKDQQPRPDDDKLLDILDLTLEQTDNTTHFESSPPVLKEYNILELGAGTGCLGVGLSIALNRNDGVLDAKSATGTAINQSMTLRRRRPTAKLMCTDNDRNTLKNLRFNVSQQPQSSNLNKSMQVQSLSWGQDVGGTKFSDAVKSQFGGKKDLGGETATTIEALSNDPLCLITHIIASDVHFGLTTLDPLSSVIAACKLRNPKVIVVVICKERNPSYYHASILDLKYHIEDKVKQGLESDEFATCKTELDDFSVSVRHVLHSKGTLLKLIEC